MGACSSIFLAILLRDYSLIRVASANYQNIITIGYAMNTKPINNFALVPS